MIFYVLRDIRIHRRKKYYNLIYLTFFFNYFNSHMLIQIRIACNETIIIFILREVIFYINRVKEKGNFIRISIN